MTFELAFKLYEKLKKACPVDTGQLKGSIQMLQLSESTFIIIIGNDDGSVNGTPSNQYASITNDNKYLTFQTKENVKTISNPNYHWVNDAVESWARENYVNMTLETEEDGNGNGD